MIRTKQADCERGTRSHPPIRPRGFTSVETPASEAHLKQLKHSFDHINGEGRHNLYCLVSLFYFFTSQERERTRKKWEDSLNNVTELLKKMTHMDDARTIGCHYN